MFGDGKQQKGNYQQHVGKLKYGCVTVLLGQTGAAGGKRGVLTQAAL